MERIRVFTRVALLVGLFCGCADRPSVDEQSEVLAALTTFLRAFENGDLDQMQASFAQESRSFPRTVMSSGTTGPIETTAYRRVTGLPPGIRTLISSWEDNPAGPPYMTLDPKDLEVQMFRDAAVKIDPIPASITTNKTAIGFNTNFAANNFIID